MFVVCSLVCCCFCFWLRVDTQVKILLPLLFKYTDRNTHTHKTHTRTHAHTRTRTHAHTRTRTHSQWFSVVAFVIPVKLSALVVVDTVVSGFWMASPVKAIHYFERVAGGGGGSLI